MPASDNMLSLAGIDRLVPMSCNSIASPSLLRVGMQDLALMTRQRTHALARITGHAAWWVFVVGTLVAGGITWLGIDHDYYRPFIPSSDEWTAYTPLTDETFVGADSVDVAMLYSYDRWTHGEMLSALAFVVVLIAAVVEAVSAGRLRQGVITVLAPCVALGLLLIATPGTIDDSGLELGTAVFLILAAVAVREVWARGFAPRSV